VSVTTKTEIIYTAACGNTVDAIREALDEIHGDAELVDIRFDSIEEWTGAALRSGVIATFRLNLPAGVTK